MQESKICKTLEYDHNNPPKEKIHIYDTYIIQQLIIYHIFFQEYQKWKTIHSCSTLTEIIGYWNNLPNNETTTIQHQVYP